MPDLPEEKASQTHSAGGYTSLGDWFKSGFIIWSAAGSIPSSGKTLSGSGLIYRVFRDTQRKCEDKVKYGKRGIHFINLSPLHRP